MLKGFSTYCTETERFLSITSYGVALSAQVVKDIERSLRNVKAVEFLCNPEDMQVAIRALGVNTSQSWPFNPSKNCVRWASRDLLRMLVSDFGVEVNRRYFGKFFPEENALIFDLSHSFPMRKKGC